MSRALVTDQISSATKCNCTGSGMSAMKASVLGVLPGDERGSALLEMAVVIPVLLTIGLGVFEFGNLYYKYHLIENAVRDAARFAASRGVAVCSAGTTQDEVIAIAKRTGQASGVWPATPNITVTCTAYNNKAAGYKYRGGDTIQSVKVSASVPYNSLGLLGFLRLTAPTLNASHEERVIGG